MTLHPRHFGLKNRSFDQEHFPSSVCFEPYSFLYSLSPPLLSMILLVDICSGIRTDSDEMLISLSYAARNESLAKTAKLPRCPVPCLKSELYAISNSIAGPNHCNWTTWSRERCARRRLMASAISLCREEEPHQGFFQRYRHRLLDWRILYPNKTQIFRFYSKTKSWDVLVKPAQRCNRAPARSY